PEKGWPATYHLVHRTTSPQGQPIRKVTVFNATTVVRGQEPQVLAHMVYDAQNKLVCFARISSVRMERVPNATDPSDPLVVIPRKVRLEWPADQLQLDLTLDKVTINPSLTQARSGKLFTRPNWEHIKPQDLAHMPPPRGMPTGEVRQTGEIRQ